MRRPEKSSKQGLMRANSASSYGSKVSMIYTPLALLPQGRFPDKWLQFLKKSLKIVANSCHNWRVLYQDLILPPRFLSILSQVPMPLPFMFPLLHLNPRSLTLGPLITWQICPHYSLHILLVWVRIKLGMQMEHINLFLGKETLMFHLISSHLQFFMLLHFPLTYCPLNVLLMIWIVLLLFFPFHCVFQDVASKRTSGSGRVAYGLYLLKATIDPSSSTTLQSSSSQDNKRPVNAMA